MIYKKDDVPILDAEAFIEGEGNLSSEAALQRFVYILVRHENGWLRSPAFEKCQIYFNLLS
jgi:hypothetical protein